MYNRIMFDEKHIMEWEYKDNFNKTWGACKMFFKKHYEFKKCYSNARPGRMVFESAENVVGMSKMVSNKLKNYLDGIRGATRADREQMNQMDSTNESMVEFCQKLIEAKIQQGKQIKDLII